MIGKYEITMYKLLILFLISIFISIGVGGYFGTSIGYAEAVNDLSVPDYCSVHRNSGGPASVTCSELENLSASEFCELFSTPIRDKIRVTIVN